MFLTLLLVTLCVSAAVSLVVTAIFSKSIDQILQRIISDDLGKAWYRYVIFAIFVVGISNGVRIWDLEKYITQPQYPGAEIVTLTGDRWVLEVYRTIVETLQGLAWVLLVFFMVALLAYVVVRVFEVRRGGLENKSA